MQGAQAMQLAHSGPVHIADLKVCRQRDTSRCKGSELCHRPSGEAGGRVGAEVRQRGGGCVGGVGLAPVGTVSLWKSYTRDEAVCSAV